MLENTEVPQVRGLGIGAYTVSETCHVLRPSMTPRKVHYWLDTDLLGVPIREGSPGVPTLLAFDQILKIRTLQFLRDELRFSLQRVRKALGWLLRELGADEWHSLTFFRSGREVAVTDGRESMDIPAGQGILIPPPEVLTEHLSMARRDWEARSLEISGFAELVSSARILGGSPVVRGTRIETSFIAHLGTELPLDELQELFPQVSEAALQQALAFEGLSFAA